MTTALNNIIHCFRNGNTLVTLFEDGTKVREYEGTPAPVFPETIDLKLTDHCDLGCKYCHESSTTSGKHGDIELLLEKLSPLPEGIELALGGGDALSHPDFMRFAKECKRRGWICNLTINQGHLARYSNALRMLVDDGLIKGVGVSITSRNYKLLSPVIKLTPHVVFHVIAGVHGIGILRDLHAAHGRVNVLVLGYKKHGFGVSFHDEAVDRRIHEWYMHLPIYLDAMHLSFDNLAIEQLNMKRFFTDAGWERFYLGDDFSFSMYIDAVRKEYSPTSRTFEGRKPLVGIGLLEYFQQFRNA